MNRKPYAIKMIPPINNQKNNRKGKNSPSTACVCFPGQRVWLKLYETRFLSDIITENTGSKANHCLVQESKWLAWPFQIRISKQPTLSGKKTLLLEEEFWSKFCSCDKQRVSIQYSNIRKNLNVWHASEK